MPHHHNSNCADLSPPKQSGGTPCQEQRTTMSRMASAKCNPATATSTSARSSTTATNQSDSRLQLLYSQPGLITNGSRSTVNQAARLQLLYSQPGLITNGSRSTVNQTATVVMYYTVLYCTVLYCTGPYTAIHSHDGSMSIITAIIL